MSRSTMQCKSCGVAMEGRDGIFPLCSCNKGAEQPLGVQQVSYCPQTADTNLVAWKTVDRYLWFGDSARQVHIISNVVWGEERESGVADWEYRTDCGGTLSTGPFFFGPRPPRLWPFCESCLHGYRRRHQNNPVDLRVLKAPAGETRVLRVCHILGLYFLEMDTKSREQAITTVEHFNAMRVLSTEDVFCAYDDRGECVAGKDVLRPTG